jgi:hypothetical protein
VTVSVLPAIVNVPVRELVVVLGATEYETVPLAEPLAPPVTVIQLALLAAVHVHPVPAVTFALAVPPPAGSACVVGDTVYVHVEDDAAFCVTVTVWPATDNVPVRAVDAVFAATE